MESSVVMSPHSSFVKHRFMEVHAECKSAEMPHFTDKRLSCRICALDCVCSDLSGAVTECGQNYRSRAHLTARAGHNLRMPHLATYMQSGVLQLSMKTELAGSRQHARKLQHRAGLRSPNAVPTFGQSPH